MKYKLGERPHDHIKISKEEMTPDVRRALEENYRRGFQQGFHACLHAPSFYLMTLQDKIRVWRFSNHNGRVVWPPEHRKKRQGKLKRSCLCTPASPRIKGKTK